MKKTTIKDFEIVGKEENIERFLKLLNNIEPVKAKYSSEEMVRLLRTGKEQELYDNKLKFVIN